MSSVSKKKRLLVPKSRKETLSSYTQRQPAPTPGHQRASTSGPQEEYVQNQDASSEQDVRPIKNVSRVFLQHQYQRQQQQYQYQQQQRQEQQQQKQHQYQYRYPFQQQQGFVFMQPPYQRQQGASFNDLPGRQQLSLQIPNQLNTLYIPPPSTLPSFESSTHRPKFGFDDSKNNVKNDASRLVISKRQKVTDLRFDGFSFPNAQLTPLPPKKTTTEKPSYQSNLERCKCMTKGKGYLYNYISYIMSDPKFNGMITESREREKGLMRQLAKKETSRFIK